MLSQSAEPEGPLLDPSRYLGRKLYPKSARAALQYLVSSARRNFWELRHLSVFPILFWPIFVTSICAFAPHTWSRNQMRREVLPFVFLALAIVPLVITPVFSVRRLLLPVIPLALLWSAKGIDQISGWVELVIRRQRNENRTSVWGGWSTAVLLCSALSLFGSRALQNFPELLSTKRDSPMKEAGLWLHEYAEGPKRIMDRGTIVSYYSGATWLPMPSAAPPLTLKYVALRKPDFVVLEMAPWNTRTLQLSKLLDTQSRIQLLHAFRPGSGNEVRIYRWTEQHR